MVRGFQKLDILPRPLAGIAREENVADDRNAIGARLDDFNGAVQGDAANGHNWLVCQRPNPANQFASDYWIWVGFRGRGKHRPNRSIVSRSDSSFLELFQRVRRNSQQFPSPDHRTRRFRSQIFLSDVTAARVRGPSDIS